MTHPMNLVIWSLGHLVIAVAAASRATRSFRWLLLKGDRLFPLERLHSFNRKFFPDWRRRYFCFERWADLPLAGLAYLHAESLLTPPGPWVRSSHDLAAQ